VIFLELLLFINACFFSIFKFIGFGIMCFVRINGLNKKGGELFKGSFS